MKCVLHIGTEKTGTTALQSYLGVNRRLLARHGIHVCASVGLRNNRALAEAMMAAWRMDDYFLINGMDNLRARKAWRRTVLAAFEQEVSAVASNQHTFVVSSEHFHSRLAKHGEIRMLERCLRSVFEEVEVVCYLRRQDKMSISLYSTVLAAGHIASSMFPPDPSLPRSKSYYDFEKLLDRWANVFGEGSVTPRIYDSTKLQSGGITKDFLDLLGADIEVDTKRFMRKNQSLSAEAQQVVLWANGHLSDRTAEDARALRKLLIEKLRQVAPGDERLPPREEVLDFMKYYKQSNIRCARRWFDRDTLFEGDFSEYPLGGYGGDPERVEELIAQFSDLICGER